MTSLAQSPSPTSHRHHFVSKRRPRRWAFDRTNDPNQARVWTGWRKTFELKPLPVQQVMLEIDHQLIGMEDGTDSSSIDSDLVAEIEKTAGVITALIDGTRTTASLAPTDRRALAIFMNLLRGSVQFRADWLRLSIGSTASDSSEYLDAVRMTRRAPTKDVTRT